MNLLAIVLYNRHGERRVVEFRPGQLNVVTGWSATGKSALLDITEFCLGRATVTMPVGPITDTVVWYAALIQLPTTRAFVARPAPRPGRASTQQAMLEFGADLRPLDFADLIVNTDSATVREQLGRQIGIGENLHEPESGSLRSPLEANLGHALLLCLQRQGEIGNRDLLFHRQGEPGIRQAIIDTLPYFLGAVPGDQALRRQQLLQARRQLRRLVTELAAAEKLNSDVDVDLRALLDEAHAQGLLQPALGLEGREETIAALQTAVVTSSVGAQDDEGGDAGRRELERRRDALRRDLRALNEQRGLLEAQDDGEREYHDAVTVGASRLQSLDLVRHDDHDHHDTCPLCGSRLPEPDPSVAQLQQALDDLRAQLGAVQAARPRRTSALAELDARTDTVRQQLRAVEVALAGMRAADAALDTGRTRTEQQAFTKGRIDLYLTRLHRANDEQTLSGLRTRVEVARRNAEQMAATLDPDEEREQVTSRLLAIAADMTTWADRLDLEHRGNVRIDPHRLTVVTDTDTGPAPLFRIGSAENWVSYHLIAHLALHRYFVRQRRPVPHLLILDQPTQAYYPSEVEQREGVPHQDDDRAAVHRLFALIRDVAIELAPDMQIIVCDHANLHDPWFQDVIQHNWRGDALIPPQWINEPPLPPPAPQPPT